MLVHLCCASLLLLCACSANPAASGSGGTGGSVAAGGAGGTGGLCDTSCGGGTGATGGTNATGGEGATTGTGGTNATGGESAAGGGGGAGGTSGAGGTADARVQLLVMSKTAAYRHASIEAGLAAVSQIAAQEGWQVTATEDATLFQPEVLAAYRAVFFLSTTGDILNEDQQAAFQDFIEAGGGFVGVHAATDTEADWSWYGEFIGARFANHPEIQQARLLLDDRTHAATSQLPLDWSRTDEWYNFESNPRALVHVLLSLDEASYAGGTMGDHPISWTREQYGGRMFYTALGHTNESYSEPEFLNHLAGGLRWVLAKDADSTQP